MTALDSRITQVLDSLVHDGHSWDRSIIDVVAADGELAAGLLSAVIDVKKVPSGGLIEGLFCFVPETEIKSLVDRAVSRLTSVVEIPTRRGIRRRTVKNETAADIIAEACLQQPSACHAHLPALFEAGPVDGRMSRAFREASPESVAFLLRMLPALEGAERRRAALSLLETRHPEVVREVMSTTEGFADLLRHVGLEDRTGTLSRLYPESPRHLAFPQEYLQKLPSYVTHVGPKSLHPTWVATPAEAPHSLGGRSGASCPLCGAQIPRLLRLGSIPEGLGVTSVPQIDLVACFSCLGWEAPVLSYQHDDLGQPSPILPAGVLPHAPQFPTDTSLAETPVALVSLGPRWHWQEWSNPENVHRVGGHPSWVQSAEYPTCPGCGEVSRFLAQFNSDLPATEHEDGWAWGSGGVCYAFWCDRCKISSVLWQCT